RADIVVGSRYAPGASAVRRAHHRELLSRLGSLYAGAVLQVPLRDLTGGYRGYRRAVLQALDLDHVTSRGYAVQIELNHRCHQAGFHFEELPITFRERAWGRSKMSFGIVFEALVVVATLRLKSGRGAAASPPPYPVDPPAERFGGRVAKVQGAAEHRSMGPHPSGLQGEASLPLRTPALAGGGRPPPPDPLRCWRRRSPPSPRVVGDGQRLAALGYNSIGPAEPGLPAPTLQGEAG